MVELLLKFPENKLEIILSKLSNFDDVSIEYLPKHFENDLNVNDNFNWNNYRGIMPKKKSKNLIDQLNQSREEWKERENF